MVRMIVAIAVSLLVAQNGRVAGLLQQPRTTWRRQRPAIVSATQHENLRQPRPDVGLALRANDGRSSVELRSTAPAKIEIGSARLGQFAASALISVVILLTCLPALVSADEYGVETEAPTLFTGESVMVGLSKCSFLCTRDYCLTNLLADFCPALLRSSMS